MHAARKCAPFQGGGKNVSSFDSVTYPCAAHALPFRTMMGEYRARREPDLAAAVSKYVLNLETTPTNLQTVWDALEKALAVSEDGYSNLAAAKDVLSAIKQEPGEEGEDFRERMATGYDETLKAEKDCQEHDRPLKQILHEMQATAVCLSGGGIRSASFSLGVLEGLSRFSRPAGWTSSRKTLMDSLDYLSTVSGGGYIGSWLMAWAYRSRYQQVVSQLATSAPTSGDPEPQPIRHLRQYTSYLSPRFGFTLDAFTLGAIVLRNMILNWLTLVPVIVCLLCLPELLWIVSYGWPLSVPLVVGGGWYRHVMWASLAFIAVASAFAAVRTGWPPRLQSSGKSSEQGRSGLEFWLFVLPLFLGSWLLGETWMRGILKGSAKVTIWQFFLWQFRFAVIPPVLMSIMRLRLLIGPTAESKPNPFRKHDGSGDLAWRRLLWSFVAPFLVAGLAALSLALCASFVRYHVFPLSKNPEDATQSVLVVTIPLIWIVLMIASTFLSGLLSNIEQEEEREWWGRAGGLLFVYLLLWVGFLGVAFFADNVLRFVHATALTAVGIGLGSGYLGSLAGLSAATASGLKRVKIEQLSKFQQWLSRHNLLAPVASGTALVCITFGLADLTTWVRNQLANPPGRVPVWDSLAAHTSGPLQRFCATTAHWVNTGLPPVQVLKADLVATLIIFAAAAVIALLGNLFINVNTFSLHGMYRMRLTRAYLGASNFARHPDAFTQFDSSDNLYEADLPRTEMPLHVINTALNMVATKNLAWQQRKAESFTFSPVSCGCWRLGYLPTDVYGGSKGLRLGTAMAISGAALNPNMGYNSSPLVTLLMTFFNARLGWWLPNPVWPALKNWQLEGGRANKFLRRNGPKWALIPLLDEALGNTDDTYQWIELSDGGHFENLGLYEMVLRRCQTIIVVDADSDCDLQFEDLGNAIRKIAIDLGIPITFPHYQKRVPMKKGVDESNVYCFEGEIGYDCVDEGAKKGKLLVIKPVLNGSEPPDILAYYASHPDFPHESTANQFFNEAQFESYRHLGSWAMWTVAERPGGPPASAGCDMEAFIAKVKAYRNGGQVVAPEPGD